MTTSTVRRSSNAHWSSSSMRGKCQDWRLLFMSSTLLRISLFRSNPKKAPFHQSRFGCLASFYLIKLIFISKRRSTSERGKVLRIVVVLTHHPKVEGINAHLPMLAAAHKPAASTQQSEQTQHNLCPVHALVLIHAATAVSAVVAVSTSVIATLGRLAAARRSVIP